MRKGFRDHKLEGKQGANADVQISRMQKGAEAVCVDCWTYGVPRERKILAFLTRDDAVAPAYSPRFPFLLRNRSLLVTTQVLSADYAENIGLSSRAC